MKLSHEEEPWWLTHGQRQLICAIFGEDTIASEVRTTWIGRTSIEMMEKASMPLVPLLFRSSSSRAIEEAEIRPFKGVYRRTWYHNHLVMRDLALILARFRAATIKTLLPGDLSILVTSYKDIGLRSLDGLGVLVHPDQVDAAADLLLQSGWKRHLPGAGATARLDRTTSIGFTDGAGKQFELRWDLGSTPSSPAARAAIWSTAVPVTVLGEQTLALSPTDQLLATRQAGCWQAAPSGRWVADALTVLMSSGSKLEWSRIIEFSQPSRMSLWAYSRMNYLQKQWSVPVPAEVLEVIDHVPKSVIDRMEYRVRQSRIPLSSDSAIYRTLRQIMRSRAVQRCYVGRG